MIKTRRKVNNVVEVLNLEVFLLKHRSFQVEALDKSQRSVSLVIGGFVGSKASYEHEVAACRLGSGRKVF